MTLRWIPAKKSKHWWQSGFILGRFSLTFNRSLSHYRWPWFSCGGSYSCRCCWSRLDGGVSRRAPPMRERSGPDTGSTESRATRSLTKTPTARLPLSSWSPDICLMTVRMYPSSLNDLQLVGFVYIFVYMQANIQIQILYIKMNKDSKQKETVAVYFVFHPTCLLCMGPFSTQSSTLMVSAHPLFLTHTHSSTHTHCRWPLLSWTFWLKTDLFCENQQNCWLCILQVIHSPPPHQWIPLPR